ncbi:hypothetical protein [Natranaerobius trueperi]|uniref:Uncharacterized protein n=1 Tax=Natranaerobius trueperi TaxID=759412 RepID=A0A226BXN6_9FIRM|nr:hypothetical protein [Natranaerobius trueperi]OWZ83094.1 hypothetical protein CDO51_10360 [Natranaerobius trueperi]
MEENTNIDDNLDPYGPYETATELYPEEERDSETNNDCIHQVICPNCEITWYISLNKMNF